MTNNTFDDETLRTITEAAERAASQVVNGEPSIRPEVHVAQSDALVEDWVIQFLEVFDCVAELL